MTTNYILFVANEMLLKIHLNDISSIQKANYAGMIPNSIIIVSNTKTYTCCGKLVPMPTAQSFFTSIHTRDDKFHILSLWLRGELDEANLGSRKSSDGYSMLSNTELYSEDASDAGLESMLDMTFPVSLQRLSTEWDWSGDSLYSRFIKENGRFTGTI